MNGVQLDDSDLKITSSLNFDFVVDKTGSFCDIIKIIKLIKT